ncbi:MAG: carbonic anhydrase [Lachnospiraceae bacterium]|nr:carbonic anhydrase [Lachnospiraceae bacterium]
MDKNEALKKLLDGNRTYLDSRAEIGDISPDVRKGTSSHGQQPFAIVITCSDSRVIPEAIFHCGIGDLFVIRVAGNVIDNHQLGSIEYAADHLGTKLVMVLGHTHCGAVDAAIHHDPAGYIKFITDEIQSAIGDVKDPYKACCLNVKRSIDLIESSLVIRKDEEEGLAVIGAMYDIETGKVEILP